MAVSSTTGGLRTGVCLSTDRPDNPYNGQVIYETDTNRTLVWDNSAWVVVADPALVSFSGTGATVTADAMTVAGENVTPYTGRRNLLYNGAMQVAQRGASSAGITSTGYFTTDRWGLALSSIGTYTQSKEADGPDGFSSSLKLTCTTADSPLSAGDYGILYQALEGQDLQNLKKGTSSAESLTLSFWVKSNITGTYIANLLDQDNVRQISSTYSINSSGVWEYKTITFDGDVSGILDNDNGSSLQLRLWVASGSFFQDGSLQTSWGTSGINIATGQTNLSSAVNNYWQITGVQLELGDKATPFEYRSYGEELALCQRYYQRNLADGDDAFASGVMYTSTTGIFSYSFPKMRTAPTITFVGSGDVVTGGSVTGVSSSAVATGETQLSTTQIGVTTSSLTAGHGALLRWDGSYFELSAEL